MICLLQDNYMLSDLAKVVEGRKDFLDKILSNPRFLVPRSIIGKLTKESTEVENIINCNMLTQ